MATRNFIGRSQPIAQVTTITIGGTPASSDTVTVTINRKEVTYTVSGTMTAAQVAGAFATLLAGTLLAEFQEISWYNDGTAATVICTANTAGVPFTLAASRTGSVTISASTGTASRGPFHLDDTDNWDTFPTASDDVVFPVGTETVLYGLTALTSLALGNVYFNGGSFGLPAINVAGYVEYRTSEMELNATNIFIGDGITGVEYLRALVPNGVTVASVLVRNGQSIAADPNSPSVIIRTTGTGAITRMDVETGGVGLGTISGGVTLTTLNVGTDGPAGSVGASDEEAACSWSTGCTITTVTQYSGQVIGNTSVAATIRGGSWLHSAGNIGAVTNTGGQLVFNSNGSLGAVTLDGPDAVLDLSGDTRAVSSIASISVLHGARFIDPKKRLGNVAVALDRESAATCDWGRTFTLTRS